MAPGDSRSWPRLIAALLLAPFLSAAVLAGGFGALSDGRAVFFPYLWLYLVIDGLVVRRALNDGQVFLLGGAFSFLYEGLFTKRMQDGLAWSGLDWVAVLGGPLEWGMMAVMWFHCLQAFVPREKREEGAAFSLPRVIVIAAISLGAGLVFAWKTVFGHYRAEGMLGPMWLLDDIVLAAAAFWLWRQFQRSLSVAVDRTPPWFFGAAGLGLWLLGSGLLAQVCDGLDLPRALFFAAQALWLAGLGFFLWTAWRGRGARADEPVRRSRPVLAAAAWRVGGTFLLLFLFGSMDDPRMAFWAGILCDWPSKMLFYYAFLTSRLEV